MRVTIGTDGRVPRGRADLGDQRRFLAGRRAPGLHPLALPPGDARRPAGRGHQGHDAAFPARGTGVGLEPGAATPNTNPHGGLAARDAAHYLALMPLPRPASPRALWADIRAFWRYRPRHQWVAAVLAVLMPVGIVIAFYYRRADAIDAEPDDHLCRQLAGDPHRRRDQGEAEDRPGASAARARSAGASSSGSTRA